MIQTLNFYAQKILTYFTAFIIYILLLLNSLYSAAAESDRLEVRSSNSFTSSDDVINFVAPLDDETVRSLLINNLSEQVSVQHSQNNSHAKGEGLSSLSNSVDKVIAQFRDSSRLFRELFLNITGGEGIIGFFMLLMKFFMMCAGGAIIEKIICWKFGKFRETVLRQQSDTFTLALFYSSLGSLIDLFGIAFFAITGFLISLSFSDLSPAMEMFLYQYFIALLIFRFVYVLSSAIFSPSGKTIRILNLNDDSARRFHTWILLFTAVYTFGSFTSIILMKGGLPAELVSVLRIFIVGLTAIIILTLFIWINREQISSLYSDNLSGNLHREVENGNQIRPGQIVSKSWPYFATIWLFLLWIVWALNLLQNNEVLYDRVSLAWWITLTFPLVDRIVYRLLRKVITIEWLQSKTFEKRSTRFVSIIQSTLRTFMFLIAAVAFAEACGAGVFAILSNDISRKIISAGTDILVILLGAYIAWEIIQSIVETRMPEGESESKVDMDGEGGGAGASRAETLMPLLRTFLLLLIVITAIISTLHSLGVQIAPLLAGAGVVGIAVGFGSQKLVQDIISGIFFLWDDAFRKGEYIEAGGLIGTVEYISIRSMRLRHHLGAVQTLPYSEISTVRNLSRDWATMKLEIRLPYDTDIDKVRKIIKKVGRKMLENEEYGSKMILPLKSQGVGRIEESTLIVRMKFTCQPGEQFVIRREAYRLVKEALEVNGIHFAHREVKVALPTPPPIIGPDKQAQSLSNLDNIRKSAAAAMTSITESNKERKEKH